MICKSCAHDLPGLIGRKLPTISDGLDEVRITQCKKISTTHILWLSLLMVNEKQHWMSLWSAPAVGLLNVQLVSIAFCCWSKQMAQNFSQ